MTIKRINRTKRFKQDYKREKKSGKYSKVLEAELLRFINKMLNSEPLPDRYYDHALSGSWKGFRDCHLRPDLILIYRVSSEGLDLVRIGSHSQLSL